MSNYTLYHGDCYEILNKIESCDLVISDPPYQFSGSLIGRGMYDNSNKEKYGRTRPPTRFNELESLDSVNFDPVKMLDILKTKMEHFQGYFFCNKSLIPNYLNWALQNKFSFDILVMNKANPMPAHSTHHVSDLEYIVLIRNGGYFKGSGLELDDYRKFYTVKIGTRELLHPAEKPIEFLERFVRTSCPEGGIVLDPFMGSGSTGVAALKNHCQFIGIEKEDKYVQIADERLRIYNKGDIIGCPETIKENPMKLF